MHVTNMRAAILSTLLLVSASPFVRADDPARAILDKVVNATASIPMNIFVAAANGAVHTVSYTPGNLTIVQTSTGCGETPSWLYKGLNKTRLWCWNEADVSGNGSVARLDIQPDGSLVQHQLAQLYGSAVHGGLGLHDKYMVSAIYKLGNTNSSAIVFMPVNDGILSNDWQQLAYYQTNPTPNPSQLQSHIHGVEVDPTLSWVIVTDLGLDKLSVFGNGPDGVPLPVATKNMTAGSGPRHAKFFSHTPTAEKPARPVYLFIINELSNTITTLNVTYANDTNHTIQLSDVSRLISTFAGTPLVNDTAALKTAAAGEIKISPDNRFLSVSNRMATGHNDNINTFSINADGSLAPVSYREVSKSPRAFEFNPTGDKVLVSASTDSSIEVFERNITTGMIGASLARLQINTTVNGIVAGINHAIWDYR